MTIKSLSSQQISLIMKKGKAYNSGFFLLKLLPQSSDLSDYKLIKGSFVSSKKVFSKAVDRNKTKRILKEAFIKALLLIEQEKNTIEPFDFVVLSKKETISADFSEIVDLFKQILLKNYII